LSAAGLAGLLRTVAARATPQALGLLILQTDLQYHRIPRQERETAVAAALTAGVRTAHRTRARHPGKNPREIAQALRIPVTESDADCRFGSTLRYAEYRAKPPLIRIYTRAMAQLQPHLADPGVRSMIGLSDTIPVFVAHELYHYFDTEGLADWPRARPRVTICRLGALEWASGLVSLCEVAAGSFAQELLGLSFHPKLLDLIAIWDENTASAERIAAALYDGRPAPASHGEAG
jgi:hypothetical protein